MAELELTKLKKMVENAAELTSEARAASERDRDYYDGHQWTAEEVAVLNSRKQPVITINRIKRKIDGMVGLEQRMRTDPKAVPRNPQDEEAAEVATKALVFVDDNTSFDQKRSEVAYNMFIEGYGGVEIVAEEVRGQVEVVINRLRWEEIFFDPHSREKDFSDASYIGCQKWMSIDTAQDTYAGLMDEDDLTQVLETSMTNTEDGETYEDRPFDGAGFRWGDKRQRRVRVAQMYYRNKGKWYLSIFCSGGEIFNDVSPYLDEDGNPTCAIELAASYVDRDNKRYGVVRDMISPQDEINARRSKILHSLNSRQTIGVKGAVDSVANLKRELASPDGHVEINAEAASWAAEANMRAFDIIPNSDQTAGQFNLLKESKDEIDMFGPNPSLIGQTQGQASGRAIMAQQQAGMAELAPLYDSLRDWTNRVYRAMWCRIRQFWTEPRWIRVTDAVGQREFVAINRVVGHAPVYTMEGGVEFVPQMENAVAEMDVDILIEETPDHVTLQYEQFEQLSDMAAKGIPIPPELLIESSTIQNKAEILERMKETQQQTAQTQQMQFQAKAQIEQAKARGQVMKDQATARKTIAEVAETEADTQKTKVETLRLARGY